MALARWKLAPSAGSSPIVGPFVAALVRGVYAGRSGPFPTLHGLRIVPGVDGGNLLSVLAYGHRVDRGDGAIGTAEALGLRPSPIGPGRLVDQPQLIDAQLRTLRRIGGIPVKELARWRGVGRQRVEHMLGAMDRALDNKLPHPRPNAAGY